MRQPQDMSVALQRAYVLFPSFTCGLVIIYKAWGPVLFITCALVAVVHTCYSLLYRDCLFDRKSLIFLQRLINFGIEFILTIRILAHFVYCELEILVRRFKTWVEQRNNKWKIVHRDERDEMSARRNSYRLSTSSIDWADKTSPGINAGSYHSFAMNGASSAAMTSTPLSKQVPWRKEPKQNGSIGLFMAVDPSQSKVSSPLVNENKYPTASYKEEVLSKPKNAVWGSNNSPKIREKGSGVKTIQTVAGPLLASTRYNIDPKLYTDISSPGLTSRLTKYATEANCKLTHQPQYSTGEFPKVNLSPSYPTVLSPKVLRSTTPVTVKVAPRSFPSKMALKKTFRNKTRSDFPSQDVLSHSRHKLFNASPPEANESKSEFSVANVLKEMSLKRHASREDVMSDLVKKQRTDSRVSEGQLDSLEEMMQKRARDDSVTSEEDTSPQSSQSNQKRAKRQKASSCHDILNSFSSSIHVISGTKRKAEDMSRCNTPDIEKHFKASSKSSSPSLSLTLQSMSETTKSNEFQEVPAVFIRENPQNTQEYNVHSVKDNCGLPKIIVEKVECNLSETPTRKAEAPKELSPIIAKAENLTDKLFMKPEPQNIEKLKNSIKEKDSEDKFKAFDKDEIKKEDIVNMRQTSMRQRLQSMFDAISGKSCNKIDPDLVIQAEGINTSASNEMTTLNSITSTTTVNTSPITTTIVPILKSDTESKSPSIKHVTFNIPTSNATSNTMPLPITTAAITSSLPSVSFGSTKSDIPPSTGGFNFSSNPATPTGTVNNVLSTGTTQNIGINVDNPNTKSVNSKILPMVPTKPEVAKTENLTSTKNSTSIQSSFTANTKAFTPSLSMPSPALNSSVTSNSTQALTPTFGEAAKSAPMFSAGSNAITQPPNSLTPVSQKAVSVATDSAQAGLTFSFGYDTKASSAPVSSSGFSFGGSASTNNNVTVPLSTAAPISSDLGATKGTIKPTFGNPTSSVFGSRTLASSSNFFSNAPTKTTSSPICNPSAPITTSAIDFKNTSATVNSSMFGLQSNNSPISTASTPVTSNLFSNIPKSSTLSNQSTITNMFNKTTTALTVAMPTFPLQSENIFTSNNSNATTTNTVGMFDSASVPSTTSLFSGTSNSSTANVNETNTPVFGQTKSSVFGSVSSTFGGTAGTSPTFPNPSTANNFQTSATTVSSTLPSFGSLKPQNASASFGGAVATTSTGSIFGGSGFGSPSSTFGTTTNTFGSTSPTMAFGSTTPAQTNASPFTLPTTTTAASSSLFNNAETTGASATFSFGSSQPPQLPQQSSSFSFGGSGSTTPSSGIFQFGSSSSSSKPASTVESTGFNFSATTGPPSINFTSGAASAPVFNAPPQAGNMFSIGSGSTAPRPRTGRARRQQR